MFLLRSRDVKLRIKSGKGFFFFLLFFFFSRKLDHLIHDSASPVSRLKGVSLSRVWDVCFASSLGCLSDKCLALQGGVWKRRSVADPALWAINHCRG